MIVYVPADELEPATAVAVVSAGVFFMTALLTGVWKWRQMMTTEDHQAHPYVDIAHRASLMYAFSAMLIGSFASLSAWSASVDFWATAFPLLYFAIAIGTYLWHGFLRDTDNQFAQRNFISTWGTAMLAVAEIGGFVVLFAGVGKAMLG